MTWNLRGLARPDLADIASVIDEYAPDIVFAQELTRRQARVLAERTALRHVAWSMKHNPFRILNGYLAEGLALLSRFALLDEQTELLTPGARPWSYRRRIAQFATIEPVSGTRILVGNAHLASHGDAPARAHQAEMMTSVLADRASAAHHVIVAGDFNAKNDEHAPFEAFRPWCRLDVAETLGTPVPTSPASRPRTRLDRILVSDTIAVIDATTPTTNPQWVKRSDHLPVIATLKVGDNERA